MHPQRRAPTSRRLLGTPGVGVGKGPAGRPEDVPDLEIFERPRFDDREGGWIELVRAGGGWLGHIGTPYVELVRIGSSVAVSGDGMAGAISSPTLCVRCWRRRASLAPVVVARGCLTGGDRIFEGGPGQIQPVEACDSTSSANSSEGFFQLRILRGWSLISEATIASSRYRRRLSHL
jgi:hypothetical protein